MSVERVGLRVVLSCTCGAGITCMYNYMMIIYKTINNRVYMYSHTCISIIASGSLALIRQECQIRTRIIYTVILALPNMSCMVTACIPRSQTTS